MYLEEPVLNRSQELNILQYWKDNQGRYPQLALMARDILSIPITTVASESSFSIGGQVISKYRNSLLSSNVEALLCTRDWLFDLEDENENEMEEGLVEDIEVLLRGPKNSREAVKHFGKAPDRRTVTAVNISNTSVAGVTVTEGKESNCSICLTEYGVVGEAKETLCQQWYHSYCIEKWLEIHGFCLICMYDMPVDGEEKKREDGGVGAAVADYGNK
ncbi:hypothetical protein E3N88_08008 [Mikania micrantha]|uniref:RING-type domain-containing protein n=1 Tax=Mikania micrantha TaxID=192012 RepID=A0A5N6PH43_9ASTR|nr:hypothetical protein E3N88_08008 [Mikania micrantha]